MNLALVAVGGATGAVLRYLLLQVSHHGTREGIPWGVVLVNVLGSFAIGFLAVWLAQVASLRSEYRLVLIVGLLGGFTTFSTYALDVAQLWSNGNRMLAVANILLQNGLCIGAAFGGIALAGALGAKA